MVGTTSGNTVATGLNKAGVAKSGPPPDCEELDSENEKDREKQNKTLSGPGTTNTNFHFESQTPAVPSCAGAAHSRVAAVDPDNKYVEGTPASKRRKVENPEGKSNVDCPEGRSFKYNNTFFHGGHTEARVIETLFEGSAGSKVTGKLTMKIDWHKSDGSKSCAPCEYCHALLCAAAKCGLEIYLCTEKNEKVALDKDCEDDLNMKDREVRERMRDKNIDLLTKLGEA